MRQLLLAALIFHLSSLGSAFAEPPPGATTLRLPLRLHAKYLAPAEFRDKDGNIGVLVAYVKDGKMEGSERARVRLHVDGVSVYVEFAVHSITHPERILGYEGVTHEYQMSLLRFQHGYKREQDGTYRWDEDSDDPDKKPEVMEPKTGQEMDAVLQRGVELWVDRALSLILLNLESDFRNSLSARK